MATKTKTKGNNKATEADVAQVIEEEADLSALDGYDNTPFESFGSLVDMWALKSRQVAQGRTSMNVKYLMLKTVAKENRAPIEQEIKQAETNIAPMLKELAVLTNELTDIMAAEDRLWTNVQIWMQLPRNLRKLLQQGLDRKGIAVATVLTILRKVKAAEDADLEKIKAGISS